MALTQPGTKEQGMPRDWLIIALGIVVVLFGVWRGRRSVRIRNSSGNIIGGDAKGTITMNYTGQAGGREQAAPPGGDKVAWVIGIVGVLVAIAGAVLAHMDAGH
jgi:hypothetical protein